MSYTVPQLKALNWLVKRDKLRLTISARPNIRAYRQDGTVFEETISTIVGWYKNHLAQEMRARAEARKAANQGTKRQKGQS